MLSQVRITLFLLVNSMLSKDLDAEVPKRAAVEKCVGVEDLTSGLSTTHDS